MAVLLYAKPNRTPTSIYFWPVHQKRLEGRRTSSVDSAKCTTPSNTSHLDWLILWASTFLFFRLHPQKHISGLLNPFCASLNFFHLLDHQTRRVETPDVWLTEFRCCAFWALDDACISRTRFVLQADFTNCVWALEGCAVKATFRATRTVSMRTTAGFLKYVFTVHLAAQMVIVASETDFYNCL